MKLFSFRQLLCLFLILSCGPLLSQEKGDEGKTVLLAILAKDKAHVLKRYLNCIDNLDYNKKLITVYVNTNNNQDETATMLAAWVKENRGKYNKIIFKNYQLENIEQRNPHDWTPARFKVLAQIREASLKKAKQYKCDYYFVVDCDNFIEPCTLKDMIAKNKPIIAPMLKPIPVPGDVYSNFFWDITENGYYKKADPYFDFLDRKFTGTVKVPVVHCTYLIDAKVIDKLGYIDGSPDYEFVIFSRIARKSGIDQYICNEKYYGCLVHCCDDLTLKEEVEIVRRWEELTKKP